MRDVEWPEECLLKKGDALGDALGKTARWALLMVRLIALPFFVSRSRRSAIAK
jgi:hypothetical protein